MIEISKSQEYLHFIKEFWSWLIHYYNNLVQLHQDIISAYTKVQKRDFWKIKLIFREFNIESENS